MKKFNIQNQTKAPLLFWLAFAVFVSVVIISKIHEEKFIFAQTPQPNQPLPSLLGCARNVDCEAGSVCVGGVCAIMPTQPLPALPDPYCLDDSECEDKPRLICLLGTCEVPDYCESETCSIDRC